MLQTEEELWQRITTRGMLQLTSSLLHQRDDRGSQFVFTSYNSNISSQLPKNKLCMLSYACCLNQSLLTFNLLTQPLNSANANNAACLVLTLLMNEVGLTWDSQQIRQLQLRHRIGTHAVPVSVVKVTGQRKLIDCLWDLDAEIDAFYQHNTLDYRRDLHHLYAIVSVTIDKLNTAWAKGFNEASMYQIYQQLMHKVQHQVRKVLNPLYVYQFVSPMAGFAHDMPAGSDLSDNYSGVNGTDWLMQQDDICISPTTVGLSLLVDFHDGLDRGLIEAPHAFEVMVNQYERNLGDDGLSILDLISLIELVSDPSIKWKNQDLKNEAHQAIRDYQQMLIYSNGYLHPALYEGWMLDQAQNVMEQWWSVDGLFKMIENHDYAEYQQRMQQFTLFKSEITSQSTFDSFVNAVQNKHVLDGINSQQRKSAYVSVQIDDESSVSPWGEQDVTLNHHEVSLEKLVMRTINNCNSFKDALDNVINVYEK